MKIFQRKIGNLDKHYNETQSRDSEFYFFPRFTGEVSSKRCNASFRSFKKQWLLTIVFREQVFAEYYHHAKENAKGIPLGNT